MLFAQGFEYKLLGLIPTDIGTCSASADGKPQDALFLLGTDEQGRDLWSRLMFATQMSLTIGLVGVALSLVLGVLLGGLSGLQGGWTDTVIQRVIEILRSIPTIPLWMGLAAALPTRLVAAAGLLRHHDHHLADRLDGAGARRARALPVAARGGLRHRRRAGRRIADAHHLPPHGAVVPEPHHRRDVTLALPAMIISETSLSFLGLGLRPPAISWGVMLQHAQNVQTLAISPWLLLPRCR